MSARRGSVVAAAPPSNPPNGQRGPLNPTLEQATCGVSLTERQVPSQSAFTEHDSALARAPTEHPPSTHRTPPERGASPSKPDLSTLRSPAEGKGGLEPDLYTVFTASARPRISPAHRAQSRPHRPRGLHFAAAMLSPSVSTSSGFHPEPRRGSLLNMGTYSCGNVVSNTL